ncbi:PREDICTED: uncharacterized protein LOC106812176 [Priapulus caudatus]|uniref:Uncharacterized protein LOC106812176 n=1 Tax=Priapulus caudatus TaxID=37621 RepID=A0ABM1EH09_PRICU|nr:PREDICTED: uncharacterized protein LOC106812176 [Priapulus caudatus]
MELPRVFYQNEGPVGAGLHSESMRGCLEIHKQATQLCLDAIDAVPFPGRGSFLLADFAAADGGNSMALFKLLIDSIRKKHGEDFDIEVVYDGSTSTTGRRCSTVRKVTVEIILQINAINMAY